MRGQRSKIFPDKVRARAFVLLGVSLGVTHIAEVNIPAGDRARKLYKNPSIPQKGLLPVLTKDQRQLGTLLILQLFSVIFKGRLRAHISFLDIIGASPWVVVIIHNGYCLPFLEQPGNFFSNHTSARDNAVFVCSEIDKLLSSGALLEVEKTNLYICSPLSVITSFSGKQRLILDLRYVNKHLWVINFKYEDI